jgi:hypothetical protein
MWGCLIQIDDEKLSKESGKSNGQFFWMASVKDFRPTIFMDSS